MITAILLTLSFLTAAPVGVWAVWDYDSDPDDCTPADIDDCPWTESA